ncbi:MAG: hypothetical protein IJW45_04290 [Oscillospiraceae bacterium]|nr:hypothetical protein [Oscillospiraceae bacterium]
MMTAMALSCFALLAVIILGAVSLRRKKESLKPVRYISYGKEHFDRDIEFRCEYCGGPVSTSQTECPSCRGAYGSDQVYLKKKREMDERYLRYLEVQADSLRQETEHIERTMAVLRTNIVMRPTYYNFDLGEPPVYTPAEDYAFRCEHCDSELHGRSSDREGCPNCGADYSANTELRIREAEDRLEKVHYEEYMRLKELEWQQNVANERKDRYISTKYAKQIGFITKYAKYIALLIVILVMVLGAVIYSVLL